MDNTAEQLKRCPMCSCTRIDLVTTYPHAFTLMLAYECNACGVRTKWCANDVEARKMWNTRADSGEAVAWLVESEKAGRVSSELHELSADKVVADVVREYGDAYGATTKRPLFTHPPRATADEVRDAERYRYLRDSGDDSIYVIRFDIEGDTPINGTEVDKTIDAALVTREARKMWNTRADSGDDAKPDGDKDLRDIIKAWRGPWRGNDSANLAAMQATRTCADRLERALDKRAGA